LEHDRGLLVGLEGGEATQVGLPALAVLGDLCGLGRLRYDLVRHALLGLGAQQPLAGAAHRERLAADHDVHPRNEHGGFDGRLREQDLERLPERVVGIVGAERDATRGAAKLGLVRGEQLESPIAAHVRRLGRVRIAIRNAHVSSNPAAAAGAPPDAMLGRR